LDDLLGQTFLVTGGNTGIGLAAARAFAGRGGRVYLTCRSREKGEAAAARAGSAPARVVTVSSDARGAGWSQPLSAGAA
jgi:NAD(P)-dependent dehydrogenase (short-subunit alcohol dehydrogenase family)